jgi:flagellar basal body-associated protein FliL
MASGEETKVRAEVKAEIKMEEFNEEHLDQMLGTMDPSFKSEMDVVKSIVPAADIDIESVDEQGEFSHGEIIQVHPPSRLRRFFDRIFFYVGALLRKTLANLWIFLRTVPKEFALFSFVMVKRLLHALGSVMKAFGSLSRAQKFGGFTIVLLIVGTGALVVANLKGRWLPELDQPILGGFADHADATFEFKNSETIPFFTAFPQDPELFLLGKLKVNLRGTTDHPLPMGAFEIYTQVDSHDTAIEMQTRQVELHDLVQRAIESQSYGDVESELGKARLKGILRKEINGVLTQGWVTEIHFKTFVLKP